MEQIKLMQFSPGSGCGCKISPKDLELIIKNINNPFIDKRLLVGNGSKDDAAVIDLENAQALISTTDFFTPIVDNAYEFGYISAVNAISDIYAMGGKPLLAISILCWPLSKIPASLAHDVIMGATDACAEAGINLAGGHSIDIPTPIFGLAVNGIIKKENIKQNNTATANCSIFLTKPLGIGILSTALKKGLLNAEDLKIAMQWMKTLNKAGQILGELKYVKAMTDVTGFGLGGHLLEICESSNINAEINFSAIPLINGLNKYIEQKTIPGGTNRNFESYGLKISTMTDYIKTIICDPQTSGGLLLIVEEEKQNELLKIALENNFFIKQIGKTFKRNNDENGCYLFIK